MFNFDGLIFCRLFHPVYLNTISMNMFTLGLLRTGLAGVIRMGKVMMNDDLLSRHGTYAYVCFKYTSYNEYPLSHTKCNQYSSMLDDYTQNLLETLSYCQNKLFTSRFMNAAKSCWTLHKWYIYIYIYIYIHIYIYIYMSRILLLRDPNDWLKFMAASRIATIIFAFLLNRCTCVSGKSFTLDTEVHYSA